LADPLTDADVDELAAMFARRSRSSHRLLVGQTAGLGALGLLDAALVALQAGDAWQLRDAVMVGGLTVAAMLVCAARLADWRSANEDGERLVKVLRDFVKLGEANRATAAANRELAKANEAVLPLIAAMRESAHSGLPVMVMARKKPAADEDDAPPPLH
jgi:hypothetical protein